MTGRTARTLKTSGLSGLAGLLSLLLVASAGAQAPATSLEPVVTESGLISLSADGAGSNDEGGTTIQIEKPNAESTLRGAWLTCAGTGSPPANGGYRFVGGDVALDGSPVPSWDRNVLRSGSFEFNNVFTEVTGIVGPKVAAAAPGLVSFQITEVDPPAIDGCGLYAIFDDPQQTQDGTIFLLFGGQNPDGDQFPVTLAEPLLPGDTAELGLAISFGAQSNVAGDRFCGTTFNMFSTIDVNGTRISSCAGNSDDGTGALANGVLITVGGIGDDPANPADPLQQPADGNTPRVLEDELYDLAALLGPGETQILVQTTNPSDDDNIFAGHILSTTAIIGEGIVLAPTDALRGTGNDHTVTATVVDANASPVSGREVTFDVTTGPNSGATGTDTTNESGEASFTYTGLGGVGTDVIEASALDSREEPIVSDPATVRWIDVDCPNDSNPFGASQARPMGSEDPVPAAIVYTGPDVVGPMAAWAGCSNYAQPLPFGDSTLPLFFTGGNRPSNPANPPIGHPGPCNRLDDVDEPDGTKEADGEEICALDFVVEITGGPGWFTSFDIDSNNFDEGINGRSIETFPDVSLIDSTTRSIRVIILTGQNPFGGPEFFHKVADVGVHIASETGSPNEGQVKVITRSGVGANAEDPELFGARAEGVGGVKADLRGVPLVSNVIGLPEPGVWLQLPSALLGLALLARLRRRRRGPGRNGGG